MKGIAQFYTFFWIFYFPTCIAFNTLPGFSSIDEAMTFILIGYTFTHLKKRSVNILPLREYKLFLCLLFFYVVYSLILAVNVAGGVWLDLLQQIRPYSIIYCTWILNPQFSEKQKKWMTTSVVITLLLRIVVKTEAEGVQGDISSGQIAINAGMIWLLFKEDNTHNKKIAMLLVLLGLISGTRSKFVGEVVCFIALTRYVKKKFDMRSSKMFLGSMILGTLVLFFVWDKFDKYYVSGLNVEQARSASLRVGFTKIIWDYFPFGPGMGTFATNGAWKYYSPLYHKYGLDNIWGLDRGGGFICDIFYPSLCQFGVFGIFMFLCFWKRRLMEMNNIVDLKYFRVALMAFLCIAIEQTADSSLLSGKGMGYCMIIGLCLNANRNQGYTDDGRLIKAEEQQSES